jgi:hypothetical protein
MVLAAPEFVVPEPVQVLYEVEVSAKLQHGVFPNGMVGSKKSTKL